MMDATTVKSIVWEHNTLHLLDQTRLPVEVVVEEQKTVEQVWDSIKQLKVRGAPAIGVAGAYGLVVAMRDHAALSRDAFLEKLQNVAPELSPFVRQWYARRSRYLW